MSGQRTSPRILVTGGAGFIGANLVRVLLDRGYGVTVLDDLSVGKTEYLDGLDITMVNGSIADSDLVSTLAQSNDHVVHLAAQPGIADSLADPRYNFEINVRGTLNLLDAVRRQMSSSEQGVDDKARPLRSPRFVFASSNAVLGRQEPPGNEDKAPLPVSPYGAAKLASEAYCVAYYESWGLGTVALRFGNVYGPFSRHKNSVVSRFLKDISEYSRIVVDGDGSQTRDFVYVADLCDAVVRALESDVSGEVFHIATGIETSIRELANTMVSLAEGKPSVESGPTRPGDVARSFSIVTKAQRYLGWTPHTDLRTGLRLTRNWFASNDM